MYPRHKKATEVLGLLVILYAFVAHCGKRQNKITGFMLEVSKANEDKLKIVEMDN